MLFQKTWPHCSLVIWPYSLNYAEARYFFLEERFPKNNFTVKDAVNCFGEAHVIAKEERILRNILGKYGFRTMVTYHEGQGSLNQIISKVIIEEIGAFQMPGIFQTIITGLDKDGPHIRVMDAEDQICLSDQGYAAIGSCSAEAEAQLDRGGYHKGLSGSDLAFLAFVAKARAEVVEGVGEATVISRVEIDEPFGVLEPDNLIELGQIYEEMDELIRALERNARRKFKI